MVAGAAYVASIAWGFAYGYAPGPNTLLWIFLVAPLTAVCGAYLMWRRPVHPMGELLMLIGVTGFLLGTIAEIPTLATFEKSGPQEWMWVPIWLAKTSTAVSVILASALVVLLPDGRIRYERERRFLRWSPVVAGLPTVALFSNEFVGAQEFSFPGVDEIRSPAVIAALVPFGPALEALASVAYLILLVAVALQVKRYRQAPIRERKQVRWVLFGGALAGLIALVPFLLAEVNIIPPLDHGSPLLGAFSSLAVVLFPASVVVAVMEPPWVDVDIVIRRSFVYGVLSFVILLFYVGIAATLGMAAGSRLSIELAVVLTVVVAVLFQPARQRLQVVADRWVFGVRPSRFEAVTELGESIDRATDPTQLLPQLVETVHRALRVKWVTSELDDGCRAETGPVAKPPVLTVPIEARDEEIGRIDCGPAIEGGLGDDETQLLPTLARQVGMAVTNARLAGRIVTAAEAERRRIERNIHDGAQQELVALVARLGMARASAAEGHLSPAELDKLQYEARRILTDLRELAQGIHPSVLTDGGLLEAVVERCSRLPLEISVETSPGLREERYGDDIEGAAYFFVTEALTNVLKHAGAASARVSLHRQGDRLRVEVTDDGRGFDSDSVPRQGLDGLRDRILALGGTMTVRSSPTRGTTIAAVLPVTS